MSGINSPADILGIANQTDPTRGAAEVGYASGSVAAFLNELANGTAMPIANPTGAETIPASLGAGLRQVTTESIAQLGFNMTNSDATVPLTTAFTALTQAQYDVGIITFTGTLTAPSYVQMPNTSGVWVFANNTGGAYPLALQTPVRGPLVTVQTAQLFRNDWQGNQLLYATPRTNSLLQSAAFGIAPWVLTGSTVVANAVMAPDGTMTADNLVEDTSTGVHSVYQTSGTVTAGSTFTWSVYLKAAGRTQAMVQLNQSSNSVEAIVNLSNGTIVSYAGAGAWTGATATITPAPNGFYRVSVTATAVGSTTVTAQVLGYNGTTDSYTGLGTTALVAWGAQLELGSVSTSYIPTTTTAVTTTDYTLSSAGLVTMPVAPVTGAALTWTGTYLDALGGLGNVTSLLFGTGNGVLTAFLLTPITGVGGTTALAPQGKSIIAYSDGTNVILASSAGASTLTKYDFIVATQGQTQINVNYTPGNIIVSRLGQILPASDYVATSGSSITFNTGLNLNDEVSVTTFTAFSAIGSISIYEFIAIANQTIFLAGYTPGAVQVFHNGSLLLSTDYTASNGTSVTLNIGCNALDEVKIISQQSSSVANTVPINGGTYTGPVTFNSGAYGPTQAPGDFSTAYATDAFVAAAIAPFSGRNRLINGNGIINQRGYTAFAVNASGYGGPDRWAVSNSGTGAAITQLTGGMTINGVAGSDVAQQVATAGSTLTSTNYLSGLQQAIEGYNCFDLVGQPVTLSFWFYATQIGLYNVALTDYTHTHSFVTQFNVPTASTPQFVTISIPALPLSLSVPQSSAGGLILFIGGLNQGTYQSLSGNLGTWQAGDYLSGTGAVVWSSTVGAIIAATQIQLEAGKVATPFEREIYSATLAKCQRYAYAVTNYGIGITWSTSVTYSYGMVAFPVQMRANPTLGPVGSFTSNSGADGTPFIQDAQLQYAQLINNSSNWTLGVGVYFTGVFNSEL